MICWSNMRFFGFDLRERYGLGFEINNPLTQLRKKTELLDYASYTSKIEIQS